MNRREFTKLAAISSLGLTTKGIPITAAEKPKEKFRPLSIHLFSKQVQFLGYEEMSEAAAEMGFDGLDLTVRPKGHVLPENVRRDLPKAVKAMNDAGLLSIIMATRVNQVEDPVNATLLKTAADQGIQYYRMGYYTWDDSKTWQQNLDTHRPKIEGMAKMNEKLRIHGGLQNHAGKRVGAYLPDIAYLLDGLNPTWMGCQFDIRHATVDGGQAWPTGIKWLQTYISTITAKDFIWFKDPSTGVYRVKNVPMGQGMVDWIRFFKTLRAFGRHPVVSLHAEYDLGGATGGNREITLPKMQVLNAYKRDLKTLRKLWKNSFEV